MNDLKGMNLKTRLFSILACVLLLSSTLLVGISMILPNVEAGSVDHTNSNVELRYLTDFGRIMQTINWGTAQTAKDPQQGFGFIGLVLDHDGYQHTAGIENIADSFTSYPYASGDDLKAVSAINMVVDNGNLQKSIATFRNEGVGTTDAFDIQINQTTWTVTGKDWAIIQWDVSNIKLPAASLTNFRLGYEIPFSQTGARSGVGGDMYDGGDDIDGFDATYDTYWVIDNNTGIEIGVASAISSDPITHYYGEDYHAEYRNESNPPTSWGDTDPKYYKNFFANETWLYNRISAPNALATDGVTPGNVTTTVGWDGETIATGTSRTFTLIIAMNNTHNDMITAIQDAQSYYNNILTGYLLTEIKDSASGAAQIEVYNFGRAPTDPTDPSTLLSFEADGGPLTGTWSNNPIPTYGYSTFTVDQPVNSEGATITLFENAVQIDEVSYGQKGLAPDPLDSESTARQFDISTLSYTDLWLRDSSPTWDLENDVADTVPFVWVVINRVMFNPNDPQEGYVELRYNGLMQWNISGYKIVCNNEYIVPGITILNSTNPYFVLPYSAMNAFFNNMDADGDNVYLYDASDNLIDMVGWSSQHTKGMFMARSPDGAGTYQGYDDATSTAEGWAWDFAPNMIMTEFYADPTSAQIEIYNPRGGDKVPTLWTLDAGGLLAGNWAPNPVPAGGYSTFTRSGGGTPGNEGDTISLSYNGTFMESVSYGTSGIAPDPLSGESTSRYFNATGSYYTDDWTREDTTTWDAQNDVPALNLSSFLVLTEVMFDPSVVPNGKYIVITNREPGWSSWPETDYYLVADDVYPLTSTFGLGTGARLIIRYGDNTPTSDNFFNSIDITGDNVYLYGPNGELCDMVGWTTAHTQGMSVRRVPDGTGTQDGYDDASSVAASWVFDSPLQVYITEISDSESIASQIEVYNSWYPDIDFGVGFELRDSTGGAIPGSWSVPIAAAGFYAVYAVTTGLDLDGDTVGLYQNGILAEEAGYGTYGVVPDPLQDESSQRYYEMGQYYPLWGRMWDTPNFGNDNNIPLANFSSAIVLNEVLFNPATPGNGFVELYLRWGSLNISGYKLVSDVEYVIPMGTELAVYDRFYYFTESDDSVGFFSSLDVNGDNIYLYDDNGTFLDEVGWSTSHVAGESVCRVPNGNGTRDGFDDTSSYFAGWRFGCTPTIQLVKISLPKDEDEIKYGAFGDFIIYNLTITNKQQVGDTFDILISILNGYPYVIMDETMSFIISEVTLLPGESINITVIVTLPSVIPFIAWDNLTLVAQSQNSSLFRDEILLGAYVSPFIWPDKWADPTQIYVDGTGHDENTTIHLNLTGMGSVVELIQPQDVIFCVDYSGSMTPEAINLVKEGLTGYVDEMDIPDQGALVIFGGPGNGGNGMAELINPLSNDYVQLENDIANIPFPSGGTPMVAALQIAINEVNINNITGHLKVIILLTDGQPTDGTAQDVRDLADQAALDGILIFTIGLEPQIGSLDELLLQDVANTTGGMYFYAPTAEDLPEIYRLIAAYISDIAGRDPFPSDMIPMIRDVLPPWIQLVPGSFSIPPATNYVNATGYRILEWNLTSLGIGDSWEVTFQVKSLDIGMLLANDVDTSRVYFVDYFDNVNFFLFPEVLIEVLPSAPIPPRLYIDIGADPNDILLSWDEPASPGTVNYLIYRSTTPAGFDFSTIWVDTLSDLDPLDPGGVAVGDRRSWNHTGANDGTNEQWYYCIRAVNNLVEVSHTSRTIGKWTKDFPDGVSTFSIPLEPIIPMMTDNYTTDMNADYVRYMDVGGATWIQHDNGMGSGTNNIVMEVGKGYEVKFTGATTYTFLGMPGSHIQYKQGTFAGFDPDNSAKSLDVINVNPAGDVTLIWDPASPGTTSYVVYRSTTRDGFDTGSATNIATTTVQFHIDYGNATAGTQYYYMVIPENVTGAEGASTYSIGVFTMDILAGYDTLGIPLQTGVTQSLDWYCGQISNSVGINYFIESDSRWGWHSTVMPSGAFDPNLIMTEGYQVSTSAASKYIFVGR